MLRLPRTWTRIRLASSGKQYKNPLNPNLTLLTRPRRSTPPAAASLFSTKMSSLTPSRTRTLTMSSGHSKTMTVCHSLSSLRGSVSHDADGTTFVTWPPTPAVNTTGAPSFLRLSGSLPQATYETQETGSSIEYSDTSSIARFPNFQFSLHKVTLLSSLCAAAKSGKGSRKVNVLLAALEVQGPDTVRVKKGFDAGQEVSILKLVLADEQGSVCKLTAWRDVADAWGGFGHFPGLKRGDIVYFESTSISCDSAKFTFSCTLV